MQRREFLGSVAGIAATSVVGWKFYDYVKKPVRYVVPSPNKYWQNDAAQNFSNLKIDSVISISNSKDDENSSLISIVDEGTRRVKKVFIDEPMHSTISSRDTLYCIGVGASFCSINLGSLKLEKIAKAPAEWGFGGHASQIPGTRLMLVSMKQLKMGVYDRIGVYDMDTLSLVHQFSSYGFGIHEVHASASGHVFAGHYGSVPGSGAYTTFNAGVKYGENSPLNGTKDDRRGSYPPCISKINLSNGKLIDRSTHISNAQQAHFTINPRGEIFTPVNPLLMSSRSDTLTHRAFNEGERYPNDYLSFIPHPVNNTPAIAGLSIVWDENSKQVLAAGRVMSKVFYAHQNLMSYIKEIDLKSINPNCGWANGIDLHPDGVHYVVSTNAGFMTFRLDDHSYAASKSFKADLKVHSHFMIA